MKPWLKNGLLMAGGLAAAVLLCAFLWRADNKYTRPGPQPIAGVLYLDEAQLAQGVHYPIYEWEYYPGALLTPADFAGGGAPQPEQYVFLGRYSNYTAGKPGRSPHGSASYRLNARLPAGRRAYALWMPDVYCAYTLYVNGEPLARVGQPEAEGYRAVLGERLLRFEAEGQVEILVACASQGYLTGGMTHPPALGLQEPVAQSWLAAQLLRAACITAALLLGALFTSIRFSAGYPMGALFGLLCLCFAVYAGVPLLRGLLTLPMQPFAALYLGGYYAMFLLILLLQARLYGLPGKLRMLCLCGGGGVAVAAVGLSLLARPGPGQIQGFSLVSEGYKWAMVAVMLAFALLAARRRALNATPLLLLIFFFGGALAMDRLLPLYEPVLGGWFAEVAGFVVLCGLGVVLWQDMTRALQENLQYSQAMADAEQRLGMLREHYRLLDEQAAALRAVHHDFRQQFILIQSYAESGDMPALRQFLQSYRQTLPPTGVLWYTGHEAVNVLTRYYAALCGEEDIAFTARYNIPTQTQLTDAQMNVVLGNLLENAWKACRGAAADAKWVEVRGHWRQGRLVFTVRNGYTGTFSRPGRGRPLRGRRQGQGLKSIEAVAAHTGGTATFSADGSAFTAVVVLPEAANGAAELPETT